ncbi:ABC transporter permease [Sodalis sp. RH21]|uniref:ABC transporter permease n=1 Tax=unclassified Sodalis (in: enterobacteria) TaxID=2636512 RepID=UPI0039B67AE2
MKPIDLGQCGLRIFTIIVMFFLVFPILITLIVSINPREFILPPSGVTLRWFYAAWTSDSFLHAMGVSLCLAVVSALLANILVLPAAMALTRYNFRGKKCVNLLIMSPLLIPTTIFSLALYIFFVKIGLGAGLVALLIGHILHLVPYALRVLTASLHQFDASCEEAARNVGAGRFRTLIKITLPAIRTGIISSMVLCFILSWNEFPISIFLSPPGWTPLPVELYSYIKFQYDAVAAALASSLILISIAAMIILDRMAGLGRVFRH